jgi:hypothetical protein
MVRKGLVKKALFSSPIMQSPKWDILFHIICDALDFAMGAILGQSIDGSDHVINYASKMLNRAQLNYTTIEKEFLVVVFALKKFRSYLLGNKVIIHTNYTVLKHLMSRQVEVSNH